MNGISMPDRIDSAAPQATASSNILPCRCCFTWLPIPKGELLEQVWSDKVVGEEVLTVAVSQIRRALDDKPKQPRFIKTIPGQGYQLIARPREMKAPTRWLKPGWVSWAVAILLVVSLWIWQIPPSAIDHPRPAWDAYQQGRYLLSQADPQSALQALEQFDQALALAPAMGEARWGRVQARLLTDNQPDYAPLITELQRSAKQAKDFAPAHLSLAHLLFTRRWDFNGARQYFRQALALDESNPQTHFLYSQFLLAMGRFEPAMQHVQRYITLSPGQYAVPVVAWVYAMAGQPQLARLELDKIAHVSPPDLNFHMSAQAIRRELGDEQTAFIHLVAAMTQQGYQDKEVAEAKTVFEQNGLQGLFGWLLERQDRINIGHYQPPLSWARYAIAAGEPQAAIKYLQQAVAEKQMEVLWLAVDPWYAPVRERPEFRLLLRDIGVTH